MKYDTNNMILCFVLGHSKLEALTAQAMSRLSSAFRPSTQAAYTSMFRVFIAFCIYMRVSMCDVHVGVLLAFLECLNVNNVSVSMVCNYLAAIRAKFIMYGLPNVSLDDRKLHYFVKSLKINRPLSITKCNIISIEDLYIMVACCDSLYMGQVCKALFLLAFFGFFRLSNLCPQSCNTYDCTRHLAGGDVFWDENHLKILVKWSKTLQTRDKVKMITLPSLGRAVICPLRAVKKLLKLHNPTKNNPCFNSSIPQDGEF